MTNEAAVLFFLLSVSVASCARTDPAPTTPPVPPLVVPPMPEASAPPEDRQPPALDASCTEDVECDVVFYDARCCGQCAPRVGNKAWVRELTDFCSEPEAAEACEQKPMACSWGYAKPRCLSGQCVSK